MKVYCTPTPKNSTETELELELQWSFAAVESWAVLDPEVVGSGNFFGDSDNAVHLNVNVLA